MVSVFALLAALLFMQGPAPAPGEPSLQEIVTRLGYTIDVTRDEVQVELFRRARPGRVIHRPISAWGLERVCHSGWYRPVRRGGTEGAPTRHPLWRLEADQNKRDHPPIAPGGTTEFDPGDSPFGLWVDTEGFPGEVVYTEAARQVAIARFQPTDRRKARVYRVRAAGGERPDAFLIGWEYSTNNDFQDLVTLLENVRPLGEAAL